MPGHHIVLPTMKISRITARSALGVVLSWMLLSLPCTGSAQDKLPYHRDLNVVSVNKQPPRSSFMVYGDRKSAQAEIMHRAAITAF